MTFPFPTFFKATKVEGEQLAYYEDAGMADALTTTYQIGTPASNRWVVVVQTSFSTSTDNPIPAIPTISGISHFYTDGGSFTLNSDGQDSRVTIFSVPTGTNFDFSYVDTSYGDRGGQFYLFLVRGPNPNTLTITKEVAGDIPTAVTFPSHMVTVAAALDLTQPGSLDGKFDLGVNGGGVDLNPVSGVSYSKLSAICSFYYLKWS